LNLRSWFVNDPPNAADGDVQYPADTLRKRAAERDCLVRVEQRWPSSGQASSRALLPPSRACPDGFPRIAIHVDMITQNGSRMSGNAIRIRCSAWCRTATPNRSKPPTGPQSFDLGPVQQPQVGHLFGHGHAEYHNRKLRLICRSWAGAELIPDAFGR